MKLPMRSFSDTIVAPITASGGAVAVLRISGPDSYRIGAALCENRPSLRQPRVAVYTALANGDDGIAVVFEEGRSYTGDAVVELSCHGSPASVGSLLDLAVAAGARLAEPGEFTQRAFLNGRLDLTQAEGVRDTVAAQTEAQFRSANNQRRGALRGSIETIRQALLKLLVAVEASTDFSEEIGDLDAEAAAHELERAKTEVEALLSTARSGRILRQGLRIAIVGRPNAGKSSLLNALLRSDRAIVHSSPGTTRDFVEELADLGGLPAVLIDTAGLRETADPVESEGVARTIRLAAGADVVWFVYDSAVGWTQEDERELSALGRDATIVANKADLRATQAKGISVSALEGAGLDGLVAATKSAVAFSDNAGMAISPRVAVELAVALEAIESAISTIQSEMPDDLLTVNLREAIEALGRVTGETASPDLVERIFHDFCIGK